MKKSIVIIMAVAIIGVLGLVARHPDDGAQLSAPTGGTATAANMPSSNSGSVQSDNTTSSTTQTSSSGSLKDGTFTGQSEFTPYGTVKVAAVVSGGKITDIKFLQMPGPAGHSKEVTAFAEPYLKGETIQRQSSRIDFVSGATTTSEAYEQSLQAALDQAA